MPTDALRSSSAIVNNSASMKETRIFRKKAKKIVAPKPSACTNGCVGKRGPCLAVWHCTQGTVFGLDCVFFFVVPYFCRQPGATVFDKAFSRKKELIPQVIYYVPGTTFACVDVLYDLSPFCTVAFLCF